MKPIRIISDGWIFKYQKWGGINTYFDKLIHYTSGDCEWTVTLDEPLAHSPFTHAHPKLSTRIRSGLGARVDFHLDRLRWAWCDCHANLYHPTYYAWLTCAEPRRLKKPVVCTVHDFIHERNPEHLAVDPFTVGVKRTMIERADVLVCISQNTAADLDQFYPGNSSRIRVVLSGSDFQPPLDTSAPTLDYFAWVGNRSGYKNFENTLHALSIARLSGYPAQLRISGPPPGESELTLIAQLGIQDQVTWIGFLETCDLPAFYYNSIALVYPSLYEGFGLPALDAMASGSTTIAHRGSSLPEVVGDGGLLVDCTRPECIAEAMQTLIDPGKRSALLHEAAAQSAKLHWCKTANAMMSVYEAVV